MASNFLLPNNTQVASTTKAGIVKIGNGIQADTTGIISIASSGVVSGTYTKVTVDATGRVTDAASLDSNDIPNLSWNKITTDKPTTLTGYGITDSLSKINPQIQTHATITSSIIKADVNAATTEVFRVESSDSQALFQVMGNGDAKIAGVITVSGTGTSTFAGDVEIGGRLTVLEGIVGGTDVTLGEDLTITGNLVVNGNTTLGDSAANDLIIINGITTVKTAKTKAQVDADKLALTEGQTLPDVFAVVDLTNAPLFQVKGNGDTVIAGVINVNGDGESFFAGDVRIGGNATVEGGLTVLGDATIKAILTQDNMTVTGNLFVQGNTELGNDAGTDLTTINGVTTIKSSVAKDSGSASIEVFKIVDSAASPLFQVMQNGDAKIAGVITVSGTGTSTFAGDVNIGGKLNVDGTITGGTTANLGDNLEVVGNLVVKGNTTLGDDASADITTIKGVTTIYSPVTKSAGNGATNVFHVKSSDEQELFEVRQNGDTVIAGKLTVNSTGSSFAGNVSFEGDVNIGGNLNVSGTATAQADLAGDNLSLTGNLIVNGNTTLGDNASTDTTNIKGVTTITSPVTKGAGLSTNAIFKVVDSASATLFEVATNGDTTIGGVLTVDGTGTSTFTGDVNIGGALTVTQGATVHADFTGDNLSLTGNLSVNGNTTLGDASTDTILIKGAATFEQNIILSATPTLASHAVNKAYVDNIQTGLDFKEAVRVATTGNINLNGIQTVDGIVLADGNRVLVKNQTIATQNGIYTVSASTWARSIDADNSPNGEVKSGMFVFVKEGTTNKDTGWVLTSPDTAINIGTSNLLFSQFSGAGSITATGDGLNQIGTTFELLPATVTALGGVIIPAASGMSIDGNGNLQIQTDLISGINIVNNKLTLSQATDTQFGAIKVGTGISVTNGVISVNTSEVSVGTGGSLSNVSTSAVANSVAQRDASGNLTANDLILNNQIAKVNGITTAGNFGVSTITANASDVQVTSTAQTTIATFTPTTKGNHLIYIYFRVETATTNLIISVTYSDGGGSQTQEIVTGPQAIGSYSVSPLFVNAISGTPIAVKVTAGTINNVYVSANIVAL